MNDATAIDGPSPGQATDASDAGNAAVDASDAGGAPSIFVLNNNGTEGEVYGFPASGNGGTPIEHFAGATSITYPLDIGVDGAGYIYVLGKTTDYGVFVFAPGAQGAATPVRTITGAATQLSSYPPGSIAVAKDGTVYIGGSSSISIFPAGADGNVAPATFILVQPEALGMYNGGAIAVRGSTIAFTEAYAIGFVPSNATSPYQLSNVLTGPMDGGTGRVDLPVKLAFDPTDGTLLELDQGPTKPQGGMVFGLLYGFGPSAAGQDGPSQVLTVPSFQTNGNAGIAIGSNGRIYVVGSAYQGGPEVIDVYSKGATGSAAPVLSIPIPGIRDPMGVATTL